MKKRVIILSIVASAFVGALSAFAVTTIVEPSRVISESTAATDATAGTYFTSYNQSASLPDLTSAAERGVEAVVNIETTQTVDVGSQSRGGSIDPFEFFFGPGSRDQAPQQRERKGGGSGVIISADGYIVTNNHVVENASKLKVTLHNGDSFTAKVIGTDPLTDIALIKIEASDLKFLQFGNSENLRLGEWVLAVGNPYGLTSTVTAGIVSAKGRSLGISASQLGIESFIQTDAAVNPGNSGGALMTADGALVGINTLIKSPTGTYTGYSFAVPASIANKIVGDMLEYGVVQRAILGISMAQITDEWIERFGKETGVKERGGVYIGEVVDGGAAQAAGIRKGDILVQIDGQDVKSAAVVQENIGRHRPGDKVKISVKRSGEVKHFDVALRNRNGNESVVKNTDRDLQELLGAQFRPVSDKLLKELRISGGVQVAVITQGGLLDKSRVKTGFIITAINDRAIKSTSDLMRLTEKIESIDGIYPDGQAVSYRTL